VADIDFTELLTTSAKSRPDHVPNEYVRVDHWGEGFEGDLRFRDYEANSDSKKYWNAVAERFSAKKRELIHRPKRGLGGKTGVWVHPLIAAHYAAWLNPDFAVLVNETFLRVVEGDSDLAAEMMIRDHNKDRLERAKQRVLCSETNKQTMVLAQEWGTPYAQVHNDRYRGLYEMDAKQLRAAGNLEKDETPLNALSVYDLTLNSLANQRAKMAGNPLSMTRIASTLRRGHKEDLGSDLVPTFEVNRLRPSQARAIAFSPEYQSELPLMRK
jgi:KilA-N domain